MGCSTTKTLEYSDNQKQIIKDNNRQKEKNSSESNSEENKNNKSPDAKKIEDIEEEKNLFIKLHILIKNLEVKQLNPSDINEKLKALFDSLLENIKVFEAEDMIDKVSNLFINYLKPINKENSERVRNIMNLLYEKDKNPNIFRHYLFEALDKFNVYSLLGEEKENKIDDYITKNLNQNPNIQNKKNELIKKYEKRNYIIKYKDFTEIVKNFNIEMENLVIEYLLYKMKCGMG